MHLINISCASATKMKWDAKLSTHIFGLKIIKNCYILFLIFFLGREMKLWYIKQVEFYSLYNL